MVLIFEEAGRAEEGVEGGERREVDWRGVGGGDKLETEEASAVERKACADCTQVLSMSVE